jgi:hypothetical protein
VTGDWRATPLLTVEETHVVIGKARISERSLRRALEPDGDLADLAVRIGRRLFIKSGALAQRLGAEPPTEVDAGCTSSPPLELAAVPRH